MIGTTLGQYEITALLGKGGMGEVYLARDTKLEREVAIKVLPADFARNVERMARFRREAKVLASLNHANVASLYGFEEIDDTHFLVMERAEGEDLFARMKRGPVPWAEAREIAAQIAEGLAEAHARGVVHRDLKPQNLKIDPEGKVKILDFGLAFAQPAPDDSGDAADSPTITAALTQTGTILGTAAYMSPEQAAGRAVDQRADVWAFGVILFEMLTGGRLFADDTPSETLAAVIRAEPDYDSLPADVPPAVVGVLRRCLQKKPRRRFHAIADVHLALEDADTVGPAQIAMANPWRPRIAWVLPLMFGTIVGALAAVAALRPADPRVTDGEIVHSDIDLPPDTQLAGWSSPTVAIAPDGRTLAFVASTGPAQSLFVRPLDRDTPIEVPGSDGAEGPFFSPDGRWVAFAAGAVSGRSSEPRALKKYSLDTGRTTTVCEVGDYFGGTWSPDGAIYFVNVQPKGLYRVPAEGGRAEPLGGTGQGINVYWPQVLPGGDRALGIVSQGASTGRVQTIDLRTGDLTDLGIEGTFARWTTSGHMLVSTRDRTVVTRRFDALTLEIGDAKASILEDVTLSGNQAAVLAIADNGTLVYSTGAVDESRRELSSVWHMDADGDRRRLDVEPDYISGFALSPDGERLAMSVDRSDLWIAELDRGTMLRLPAGNAPDKLRPLFTPDGSSVVFTGLGPEPGAGMDLWIQPTDGIGLPRRLAARSGEFFAGSWVPGTRILLHSGYESGETINLELWSIDVDDPERVEALWTSEASEGTPHLSPDGRWLAYTSDETGRRETFLRSFPDLARKIPLGPGSTPRWSAAGDLLYFTSHRGMYRHEISAMTVTRRGDDVVVGRPEVVVDLLAGDDDQIDSRDTRGWRVHPDGGFVVMYGVPDAGEIHELKLVQGFHRELERALPTSGR